MPLHRYTHAILCRIPQSLRTIGDVNIDEARKQHLALAQLLRELDIDVVEMPPDENSPLCVFVEDIALVCNGIALIARPSEPTRLKEVFSFFANEILVNDPRLHIKVLIFSITNVKIIKSVSVTQATYDVGIMYFN